MRPPSRPRPPPSLTCQRQLPPMLPGRLHPGVNLNGDMSRATYRPVDGFPVLGLLRGLRPATTPSVDDEPSLGRTSRVAVGSVAAVPMFTVDRLTGSAPSCAPAASPRVRRRLSSWPPRQPGRVALGDDRRLTTDGRALHPSPDPPDFEPVRVLRGFNHWFTCVTPLCLARRTRAI